MDNVFSDLEQMVEALTGPLGDYAPRRRHLMVFPVFHEAAQSQVAVAFKNVAFDLGVMVLDQNVINQFFPGGVEHILNLAASVAD